MTKKVTKKKDEKPAQDTDPESGSSSTWPGFDPSWNLWQRISMVRSLIKSIEHDRTIGEGNSAYTAASHEAVRNVLRPLMAYYGLVDWLDLVSLELVDCTNGEGKPIERGKYAKRKLIQHRGQYIYNITTTEATEEVEGKPAAAIHRFNVVGYADDAGDKGPGKASTYALKTAQKVLFLISTGDDDEEGRPTDADYDSPVAAATLMPEQLDKLLYQADQYYGDDAGDRLQAMCEGIFHVETVQKIPREFFEQAMTLLKNQAVRDGKIEPDPEDQIQDDDV